MGDVGYLCVYCCCIYMCVVCLLGGGNDDVFVFDVMGNWLVCD